MNMHLQQRVTDLFQQYNNALLATCGPAGPQVGIVPYTVHHLDLHLTLSHGSDHLFNLEAESSVVLVTGGWRLHGQGHITDDDHQQATIVVTCKRLHVLNKQHSIETIDF